MKLGSRSARASGAYRLPASMALAGLAGCMAVPAPVGRPALADAAPSARAKRDRVVQAAPAALIKPTRAALVGGPARTPMARLPESHRPVDELYARARLLELQSQPAAAICLYREASQRGHAPSSRRLMELYADGAPGVARDYRVAVFFKERAVRQGVSFEPAWRR